MTNTKFGMQSAFPCDYGSINTGMSIRTWLAGMAMQGNLSTYMNCADPPAEKVAKASVAYADALIAALNQEPKGTK